MSPEVVAYRLPNGTSMAAERKTSERRTHPYGRAQFEALRADLERRLRRIYGRDWPQGFDDVIARIARARVREAYGLSSQR
ncbi:MAG TPA: hypothetical protein VF785_01205 [Gemmatimonadaceae bacterium]